MSGDSVDKKEKTEAPKKTPTVEAKGAKPAKKKRGCLLGCLIFFVLLIVGLAVTAFVALGYPRKLGWVKSKAEAVFNTDAPDRAAATALQTEVAAAGIPTKGMQIYVLPERSGAGSTAYVVLDQSKGFAFNSSASGDPFLNTLGTLAKSEAAKKNGIDHVAFEYRDPQGRTLITVATDTQDAAAFADGKITRQQFMAKVAGRIDTQNIVAVIKELQTK